MKLTFLLLASFIFISCGETINRPNVDEDAVYFPLAVGNYWVYETEHAGAPNTIDSIVIVAEETYFNRSAFKALKYVNGVLSDTLYFSPEEDKLYTYFTDDDKYFLFNTQGWFLVGDFEKSSESIWNVYTDHPRNEPYTIGNETVALNADFIVNATFHSLDSIELGKGKINSKKYRLKFDSKAFTNHVFTGSSDTVQVIRIHEGLETRNEYTNYAKNIGPVQIEKKSYVLIWHANPATPKVPFNRKVYPGYFSKLKRFQVNVPEEGIVVTHENYMEHR